MATAGHIFSNRWAKKHVLLPIGPAGERNGRVLPTKLGLINNFSGQSEPDRLNWTRYEGANYAICHLKILLTTTKGMAER
jgi:hypothetical protein